MASLLAFKRSLFDYLNKLDSLKTAPIFSSPPENTTFPMIKLASLVAENWQAYAVSGRCINIIFHIISSSDSSEECLTLSDILEGGLENYKVQSEQFIVTRIKILTRKMEYLRGEELWIGEVKAKMWIETLN